MGRKQDIDLCVKTQASAAWFAAAVARHYNRGVAHVDVLNFQQISAAWSEAAWIQYEYLFPSEDRSIPHHLAKKGFGGRMNLEGNPLLAEIAYNAVYWARKDPGGFFTDGERLTPEQLERAYILLLMRIEANFS